MKWIHTRVRAHTHTHTHICTPHICKFMCNKIYTPWTDAFMCTCTNFFFALLLLFLLICCIYSFCPRIYGACCNGLLRMTWSQSLPLFVFSGCLLIPQLMVALLKCWLGGARNGMPLWALLPAIFFSCIFVFCFFCRILYVQSQFLNMSEQKQLFFSGHWSFSALINDSSHQLSSQNFFVYFFYVSVWKWYLFLRRIFVDGEKAKNAVKTTNFIFQRCIHFHLKLFAFLKSCAILILFSVI